MCLNSVVDKWRKVKVGQSAQKRKIKIQSADLQFKHPISEPKHMDSDL